MPLFLVNIGNTHTQIAIMQDGEPFLLARYDTPNLIENDGLVPLFEETTEPWRAVASSVVPRLKEKLANRYASKIHFLTAQDFPQLDFSLIDVTTVGMDRIANAAAAIRLMDDGPAIVLDCGTCLVTEAIDSQHHFRGGAIMPGRMLMRRGLADHTAQLPLIPIQHQRPSPLGTNTHDAILAGIDLGAIGSVRQIIAETRQLLNALECKVFATGGDAPFFLENIPELTSAPPLLTIRGIATSTPAMTKA
ncbi:MAG: type III pantothenate kinase [Victivallales bacterium]|nr:type III pantothenate kinase [Victivallales bacterium]